MPPWQRVVLVAALVVGGLAAGGVASVAMGVFLYFVEPVEDNDWTTQPLEVVVSETERTCELNVSAVAPGHHDVHVIALDADSTVVIRDPSDRVLLRQVQRSDVEVSQGASVQLDLGTHEVACRSGNASMSVPLPVVPAGELE